VGRVTVPEALFAPPLLILVLVMKFESLRFADLLLAFLYFVYFIILLFVYVFGIGPIYEYMGFSVNFNMGKAIVSLFAIACILPFLRGGSKPSCFFLNMSAVLILIPSLVLYAGGDLPNYYALVTAVACFIVAVTSYVVRVRTLRFFTITTLGLYRTMTAFSILIVLTIFLLGGGRNINFNIMAVYEFRGEAADNLPGIFGYINSIATKVFIPFAMVFAIQNRRWLGLIILVGLSILFFALTSHKSPLFYPVVVIFAYGIAQFRNASIFMLVSVLVVVLLSVIDIYAFTNGWGGYSGIFSSLFARRVILIPSLLNWFYMDFFEHAAKISWANSKFTLGLIVSPYDAVAPKIIGFEYFNREDVSANTGWIGSGYANAGIVGVVAYSVLIGLLLSFLDAYSNRLGVRIVTAMFTLSVFTLLTSTDLATMLITHGLAISLLVLMITRPVAQVKVF